MPSSPQTAFVYTRSIRFHETDAAGVVYFANVLVLCHEAYEASLAAAGIDLGEFFSGTGLAIPIVHSSADFRRPLRCGEGVAIAIFPERQGDCGFEIRYRLFAGEDTSGALAATAQTRHRCIDAASRHRHPLAPEVDQWLTAAASPGYD